MDIKYPVRSTHGWNAFQFKPTSFAHHFILLSNFVWLSNIFVHDIWHFCWKSMNKLVVDNVDMMIMTMLLLLVILSQSILSLLLAMQSHATHMPPLSWYVCRAGYSTHWKPRVLNCHDANFVVTGGAGQDFNSHKTPHIFTSGASYRVSTANTIGTFDRVLTGPCYTGSAMPDWSTDRVLSFNQYHRKSSFRYQNGYS